MLEGNSSFSSVPSRELASVPPCHASISIITPYLGILASDDGESMALHLHPRAHRPTDISPLLPRPPQVQRPLLGFPHRFLAIMPRLPQQ